ncbi:MAG: hypothetical protein IPJ69_10530 [Deltaproteobacteria bacterium]|nr:MAG: hypothetical protein IPJ69_10530 [Deltaproteobacteria bacterium]
MKKLSFYALLLTLHLTLLVGCSGSGAPTGGQQTNLTPPAGLTCTPSSGARGDRVTCQGLTQTEGCNILFDTQLVPRSVITFAASGSSTTLGASSVGGNNFTFPIPPAANGLYHVKKVCGDQMTTLAQVSVVNRGTTSGSGGSSVPPSQYAECSAGSDQCGVNQVCRENHCVPSCNTAYDCGSGQICQNFQCVDNTHIECGDAAHPAACSNGLVCYHGQCNPCLTSDPSQCSRDQPVAYRGNICRTTSSTSSPILGLCGSCDNTSQCGAGLACVSGRCGACTTNSQCNAGNYCSAGTCRDSGVNNARVNFSVTQAPRSTSLLRLSWTIEGIQTASIQDAYVYGPFGVSDCSNVLKTSENADYISSELPLANGTPCVSTTDSNGRTTCVSDTVAHVLSISSLDPVTSRDTPPAADSSLAHPTEPAGILPGPSPSMTCRIPLRGQLQSTVYTRMKVSPSVFRLVIKTLDGQIFIGESRYTADGADLHVEDVNIDYTRPQFTIRGSYTRSSDGIPSFDGCLGGTYSDNSDTAGVGTVIFTKTCLFPTNGDLPIVSINVPTAIPGVISSEKQIGFDCYYDSEDTFFNFQNVYASGAICANHDQISSLAGQTLHLCPDGSLQLTTHIRRACNINVNGEPLFETPKNNPWFVKFLVSQYSAAGGCSETTGLINVDGSVRSGLQVLPSSGEIQFDNRQTRNLSCNSYQMAITDGPSFDIETPFFTGDALIQVVKNFNATNWSYDYVLSDTYWDGGTDLQYCARPGGLLGESGVWLYLRDHDRIERHLDVPFGNTPDGLYCSFGGGNYHSSDDGVTGCSKYNGHLVADIQTRGVTSFDVSCCAYGEWSHGGVERDPPLDGIQGHYGEQAGSVCAPGGRLFRWSYNSVPPISPSGGAVSNPFDHVIYGEVVRCGIMAPGILAGPGTRTSVAFDFTRPMNGRCDYPDRDHVDPDDSDQSDWPLLWHGYPVLPLGTTYPLGIYTAPR